VAQACRANRTAPEKKKPALHNLSLNRSPHSFLPGSVHSLLHVVCGASPQEAEQHEPARSKSSKTRNTRKRTGRHAPRLVASSATLPRDSEL
jgi:hypothetical protein